ncbi:MAG: undecaprenyl/decaprenyl-phosphate alpha-N-acetylglucosaminyl 1-phosphate transferase [Deltaproteobacteria bacterium]|nr:undecaprenyl/decaprenyl-phosphate alpha-N-acetylglucosaminyl 1-phosphate transferase [Deltaproteobacteria bacterium]
MLYLSTLILSLFITVILVPMFRQLAFKIHAVDLPAARKVHQQPMPKTGGLAMAAGALVPIMLWLPPTGFIRPLLLAAGIIVAFGFIDDLVELGYRLKFGAQLLAALIMVLYGGVQIRSLGFLLPANAALPFWAAVPLSVVVIVGVTNAINLADGLDGLAGGISLLAFIGLACLAYVCGSRNICLMAMAVCGAILGFLRYNTYPASIFMGDAGSQLLGFMAIVLSLELAREQPALNMVFPLLLLGMPVFDTLYVMLSRLYRGRSPFVADKNHLHHKLIRLGLYHSEAVVVIYFLQGLLVLAAIKMRYCSEWLSLLLYLLFAGFLLLFFYLANRYRWRLARQGFFDRQVKGRLRVLKDRARIIVFAFRGMKFVLFLVFAFLALLPAAVPAWLAWEGLALAGVLVLCRLVLPLWRPGIIIRVALYLVLPPLVYLGSNAAAGSAGPWLHRLGQGLLLVYGLLLGLTFLVLRYSRRRGFQGTPLDFLILFIALLVPNLPFLGGGEAHMGAVAAQIVMVFFSFEVLLEESRRQYRVPALLVLMLLVAVAVRGLVF